MSDFLFHLFCPCSKQHDSKCKETTAFVPGPTGEFLFCIHYCNRQDWQREKHKTPRGEYIRNGVQYYAGLVVAPEHSRNKYDTAYVTWGKHDNNYYWAICHCGQPTTKQSHAHPATHNSSPPVWKRAHEFEGGYKFCSLRCWEKLHPWFWCYHCGLTLGCEDDAAAWESLSDSQKDKQSRHLSHHPYFQQVPLWYACGSLQGQSVVTQLWDQFTLRSNLRRTRKESEHMFSQLYELTFHACYCSRQCAYQAFAKVLHAEVEKRKAENELARIRKVRRLTGKARKSLLNPDAEAWIALRDEFKEAAS